MAPEGCGRVGVWGQSPLALLLRLVEAALMRDSRSVISTGMAMPRSTSLALSAARWTASEMTVGWTPFWTSVRQRPRMDPARTTTEVVPSPATTS